MNLPIYLDVGKVEACPACHKTAFMGLVAKEMGGLVQVKCRNCNVRSEWKHGPGEAVAHWNEVVCKEKK